MGTGNRGEVERSAIAASMSHEGEAEHLDADAIVKELSEIKQLKADCLEDEDDKELAKELEERSDAVRAKIESAMDDNLGEVQNVMARAYREAGFDPVDLIELGFDHDTAKGVLSEKM